MFLIVVMPLKTSCERNKKWKWDTFLKGPSMTCSSSSLFCFPADSGRLAQHAAHKAICLTSWEAALSSQLASEQPFSWDVAKQTGDSAAGSTEQRGAELGELQQEDKCSSQLINTNPSWTTHSICYRKSVMLKNLLWFPENCYKVIQSEPFWLCLHCQNSWEYKYGSQDAKAACETLKRCK